MSKESGIIRYRALAFAAIFTKPKENVAVRHSEKTHFSCMWLMPLLLWRSTATNKQLGPFHRSTLSGVDEMPMTTNELVDGWCWKNNHQWLIKMIIY